jgi:hypothetical protein
MYYKAPQKFFLPICQGKNAYDFIFLSPDLLWNSCQVVATGRVSRFVLPEVKFRSGRADYART